MNTQNPFIKIWAELKKKTEQLFLASTLERIARETKFIQRSTSLLQAKNFVDLLSAASIDPKTVPLTGLCSILRELNPKVDLTPQALMERINNPNAAEFLKRVFQQALQTKLENIVKRVSPNTLKHFNNVWIEDCSECVLNESLQEAFKGSGGETSRACVKIDLIYELKQKNIQSIDLVDRRSPDQKLAQKHLEIMNKGDLIIRDLGFFDATVLKSINDAGAFFLSRLPSCVHVYINKEDEIQTDLAEYINLNFSRASVIDLQVFVTAEKVPCRLIAYRAPQELADKRRREANKAAQKKGRTPKKESLNRLDFTFLLTNVPEQVWKAEIIGTIYTARWQIELIFKSWKSGLQIHYLKGTNEHRIRCLLYAKLILIVVINAVYKMLDFFAHELGIEVSLHKVLNWLKQDNKIGKIVMKGLSCRVILSLMRELPRTLCKNKRRRKTTQESIDQGIFFEHLYNKHLENEQVAVS